MRGRLLEDRSGLSFSIFRIAFASVAFLDALHILANAPLFFQQLPFRIAPPTDPVLLCVAWLFTSLLLIVGAFTRGATIVNYILVATLLGRLGDHALLAQDSILLVSSLLLVLIPSNQTLSVDSWRDKRAGRAQDAPVAPWDHAFALVLSCVYLDAGAGKLQSEMWQHGLGSWLPAVQPNLVWHRFSILEQFGSLPLKLLSHGVIAFELSFPVLIYSGRIGRWVALASGVLMHSVIALLYPLPSFSAYMLCLYIPLFPLARFRFAGKGTPINLQRVKVASVAAVAWIFASALVILSTSVPNAPGMSQWQKLCSRVIYPLTGLSSHNVFADSLFREYNYQLRLRAENGGTVPYGEDGTFLHSVRDRVWEHWWKRTQSPWTTIHQSGRELARWASNYAGQKVADVSFDIEGRRQLVWTDRWAPELWRNNQAEPWKKVGTIAIDANGDYRVTWECVEGAAKTEKLGSFMTKCLSR
ncbi:MAG TPA: HTTM domain-containing protein [Polyangiaceae bacterium]|nr:HTTM domain-containing protein [Polyangiaceae bacterium]